MMAAGMQVPTLDEITKKEQSIKEAMNYKFNDKDIEDVSVSLHSSWFLRLSALSPTTKLLSFIHCRLLKRRTDSEKLHQIMPWRKRSYSRIRWSKTAAWNVRIEDVCEPKTCHHSFISFDWRQWQKRVEMVRKRKWSRTSWTSSRKGQKHLTDRGPRTSLPSGFEMSLQLLVQFPALDAYFKGRGSCNWAVLQILLLILSKCFMSEVYFLLSGSKCSTWAPPTCK